MRHLVLGEMGRSAMAGLGTEIVERKGLGHPDTICDAVAENLSRALSRYYLDRFGVILHHNVDKVLLAGGMSRPRFGGGEVLEPIEIFLVGRATGSFKGAQIPLEELSVEATREWFRSNIQGLDPMEHLEVHFHLRPGSPDLTELFARPSGRAPLANDTSIGVGFAPLTPLEKGVLAVERKLNSKPFKELFLECGTDIKVMGIQHLDRVSLTVPCAFVDKFIPNMRAYQEKKDRLMETIRGIIRAEAGLDAKVAVNTADGDKLESIYLTVTGTSAESGDDGQVGRGNRANGLITPFRPMTLEASAGKNPVSHTGKLYQAVAQHIADRATFLEGIVEVECYLASRIGEPIDQPEFAELRVGMVPGMKLVDLRPGLERVVEGELESITTLWRGFLEGKIGVY